MRFIFDMIADLIAKLYEIFWGGSSSVPLTGILGLAVVLFGLYYWRTGLPKPPQDQNQQHPSSTSHPSTSTASPKPSTQQPPNHPTLSKAAIRLRGITRLTVSIPGTVVQERTPLELSDSATPLPGAIHALKEACQVAEVYLLSQVCDDIGEAVVRGALEHAGVVGKGVGQISPHRVLFCETLDGKTALVRQLEPELHIDATPATVDQLRRFIGRIVEVRTGGPEDECSSPRAAVPNVVVESSLAAALLG